MNALCTAFCRGNLTTVAVDKSVAARPQHVQDPARFFMPFGVKQLINQLLAVILP
jgi:hypothetical protein